jgi:hypothetical protein
MRINRRAFISTAVAAPVIVSSTRAQEPPPPWILMAGQDSGPRGRWGHTLAIDTWYNRLLVVGGRDAKGIVRGDLWSFDIGTYTWAEIDLSGPKARSGSAAAIAADGSGFYYFGGESNNTVFDELWWFDYSTTGWQAIETTGPRPAARSGTRGAIDSQGRFIVTHGRNGSQLFDDTWAFDPATRTWTDISPPEGLRPMARADHDLVSLPDYGVMLLFGGCSDPIGPCPQGDLWVLDVFNGIWTDITPFDGPSPRTGAAMARLGNTVLLVGGEDELGLKADVWTGNYLDGYFGWTEYTQVNHGPLGIYRRAWHDMTAANGEYYVFGGAGVEGALSDLWRFSPDRIQHPDGSGEYIEPD